MALASGARRGKKRLFYSAKAGDTLAKLGRRYGLTPGDLARINRFSYNTELHEGDRIVVYSPTGEAPHEVTRGMTPGEKRPGRATATATGTARATTAGTRKTVVAEADHKVAAPPHDSKKKVAIAAVKPAPAKPARAKPAPSTTANATAKKK